MQELTLVAKESCTLFLIILQAASCESYDEGFLNYSLNINIALSQSVYRFYFAAEMGNCAVGGGWSLTPIGGGWCNWNGLKFSPETFKKILIWVWRFSSSVRMLLWIPIKKSMLMFLWHLNHILLYHLTSLQVKVRNNILLLRTMYSSPPDWWLWKPK